MARRAAPARPLTLDIKEPQILLHQPDDAQGAHWHQRVLVLQIKGARWVSLDPELELAVLDLDQVDYVLLEWTMAVLLLDWLAAGTDSEKCSLEWLYIALCCGFTSLQCLDHQ